MEINILVKNIKETRVKNHMRYWNDSIKKWCVKYLVNFSGSQSPYTVSFNTKKNKSICK